MGRTHLDHLKCCCSDASYIPLHPQRLFLINFTSNKNWDKCSLFLCLTEKTGSGRTGLHNAQLTVVINNCYESSVCVCARMAVCV